MALPTHSLSTQFIFIAAASPLASQTADREPFTIRVGEPSDLLSIADLSGRSWLPGWHYCPWQNFTTTGDPWVTSKRINRRAQQSHGSPANSFRIAVLIGSTMRLTMGVEYLDKLVSPQLGVKWHLFVATQNLGLDIDCRIALCRLSHLEAVSVSDLKQSTFAAEVEFAYRTGGVASGLPFNSMRQWFKLARAYELMLEFENVEGNRFDAVFKARPDLVLTKPLHLADFPALDQRVVYTVGSDAAWFSNREVAEALFERLIWRMLSLAGTDCLLLPIQYQQLLDSDLELSGFGVLNYPCIPAAQPAMANLLRHAPRIGSKVPKRVTEAFKHILRTYRKDFEAAHGETVGALRLNPGPGAWCTGAWWHNRTMAYAAYGEKFGHVDLEKLYQNWGVDSDKAWFYLVNQIRPIVTWRNWPGGTDFNLGGTRLHPKRHYAFCSHIAFDGAIEHT